MTEMSRDLRMVGLAAMALRRRTLLRGGALAALSQLIPGSGFDRLARAAGSKGSGMTTEKGARLAPLFLSEADARAVIADYCVSRSDDPLTSAHVDLLVSRLIPQLWVAPGEGEAAIGATRFGGAPDLPRGQSWPMRKALPERSEAAATGRLPNPWVVRQLSEDVPFEFIAQINLEEVAIHRAHVHGLPQTGRLLFFLDMAVLMDDPSAPGHGCLVVHDATPRAGLERLAIPAQFDEMERWWRAPDPGQSSHFEEIARSLEEQGLKDAAEGMRKAAGEAANPSATLRKPFVYPARVKQFVPLVVLPDRMANELDGDPPLKAFAGDTITGEHYALLTGNDIGQFSSDPDDFRRTQPWLTLEARRNRLLGPPQPEQDDPRFDCIPEAERPAYPWDDTQIATMRQTAAEWRLLLQVSIADLSQEETEGTVYFMIRDSDLAEQDFGRCRVSYQQT